MLFTFAACSKAVDKQPRDDETKTAPSETQGSNQDSELLKPTSNKISVWGGLYPVIQETFAQKYPDFEVEYTDVVSPFVPDKSVDLPRLGSAIASNESPDIFEARMSPPEAYYSNLFVPIEPYLKADPNFNIKDIDPGLLDVTTFNDVVYFLPDTYSSNILVWNKDLFENLGLDPEKPPTTWDEVKDLSRKLLTTESNGQLKTIGIMPSTSLFNAFNWDHSVLSAFGQDAHYVDETRLNFRWDTPEMLETFEFIRDLQNIYGGNEKIPNDQFTFFNGNTAMIHWNGTSLPTLDALGAKFKYGFTTMPKHDENSELYVSGHIGSAYGIPKAAKNPAGGWLYVTHKLTD